MVGTEDVLGIASQVVGLGLDGQVLGLGLEGQVLGLVTSGLDSKSVGYYYEPIMADGSFTVETLQAY